MSCYPLYLKRPLIAFVIVVVVLLIAAFGACNSGICAPAESITQDSRTTISQEVVEEIVQDVLPTEPVVEVVQEAVALDLEAIKRDFIDKGVISGAFSLEASLFFDRSKSVVSDEALREINAKLQSQIQDAGFAIVSGHACDLGSAEYNARLIQKRIEFVIDDLLRLNPNLEVVFSNDGQARAPSTRVSEQAEAERKEERRVDVYLYSKNVVVETQIIEEIQVPAEQSNAQEQSSNASELDVNIIPFLGAFCAIAVAIGLWSV